MLALEAVWPTGLLKDAVTWVGILEVELSGEKPIRAKLVEVVPLAVVLFKLLVDPTPLKSGEGLGVGVGELDPPPQEVKQPKAVKIAKVVFARSLLKLIKFSNGPVCGLSTTVARLVPVKTPNSTS